MMPYSRSLNWKIVILVNGSVDGDPAAKRYTEYVCLKLQAVFRISRKDSPFAWNFDDTEKEPTSCCSLPNLVIGLIGIAGYATDIPPHNLLRSMLQFT